MKRPCLKAGHAPNITAVITGSVDGKAIRNAVTAGATGFELRVDTLLKLDKADIAKAAKRLRTYKALKDRPLILTIRSRKEGGEFGFSDTERAELFSLLTPYTDIVDIELSSRAILAPVVKTAKTSGSQVIISYHNFKSTPTEARLNSIITEARANGADIVKIAAKAKKPKDLKVLSKLLIENKDLIVIAMGRYGAGSRVFFPMLGSLTTYGSITKSSAPGQMPVALLKEQLRLYGL